MRQTTSHTALHRERASVGTRRASVEREARPQSNWRCSSPCWRSSSSGSSSSGWHSSRSNPSVPEFGRVDGRRRWAHESRRHNSEQWRHPSDRPQRSGKPRQVNSSEGGRCTAQNIGSDVTVIYDTANLPGGGVTGPDPLASRHGLDPGHQGELPMRGLTPLGVHRREDGAVAVIVALMLCVFVAMVALAVDTGGLYLRRRELVNGSDAAALSAGRTCARGGADRSIRRTRGGRRLPGAAER